MRSGGLTKQQGDQIERFLHLFSDIEQALKKRLCLKPNSPTGFGVLVERYLAQNPYWLEAAHQLWLLADIRNLLTHNRSTKHGYPVAVTRRSITSLESIEEQLRCPVTVAARYLTAVDCVSAGDSLSVVVATAFEKGYSQFPVFDSGRFVGLITENEITRWLGRRAHQNGLAIDLTEVKVRTVLREKDPFKKGVAIFDFVRFDASVEDVMGKFMARPMLEAVLLTRTGNSKSKIEGIITQWDAARYAA